MGTYWYAYAGTVSGPFYETKAQAADACDGASKPRPIAGSVLPDDATIHADGSVTTPDDDGSVTTPDDDVPLDEMGHAELKAEAERRGVADDIDLRSKASIREALRSEQ